ncbi:uncharacterized protein [Amphiura filiformis]|uniref:uncharacterized protein n=1 Tax=Amphiura filiformis TaxID=82378 RepID=UPI003B21D43B
MDKSVLSTLLYFTILMWTIITVINAQGATLVSLVMAGEDDNNAIQNYVTEEDDTVTLICHVVGLTDDQIVSITRATDLGADDSLLWNNNATITESTKHIEFDGSVEIGTGMFLYTMIVHNVTKYDSGSYACTIFSQSGNRFTPVTSAQSTLRILHFPDDTYPICDIISANKSLTRYVDERVTFRCESELGDPEVFLDWSLSARGPSLPRADEGKEDRITYSEILVTLKPGHTGKLFECKMTSGLDIFRNPMCTIGPYTVVARPTTPSPPTTKPRPPSDPGTATRANVGDISSKNTSPAPSKTTASSPPVASTGLSKAAIAGISVIIVLSLGILLIATVAWFIKTNKDWSPDTKTPLSEKSPNTSHMSGTTDNEGPQLLGFKKRLSKKASLNPGTTKMNGKYGIENGGMLPVNNYDTINEAEEAKPSTPLTSHRPTTINPLYNLNQDPNPPSPSPTSPRSDQPFLQSPQSDSAFVTPPASPDIPQTAEESPGAEEVQPTPSPPLQPTPSPPPTVDEGAQGEHARNPSFISVDDEDIMIEGEFVSDSEQLATPDPVEVFDPSMPRNLPQDVMDILQDLDLDLFANEDTEDTEL